jgi:hypothetical protein
MFIALAIAAPSEAEAVIDGTSIIVSNARISKPAAVRYAWKTARRATFTTGVVSRLRLSEPTIGKNRPRNPLTGKNRGKY